MLHKLQKFLLRHSQPQQRKNSILAREWVAIALVGALVLMLAFAAWLPQQRIEKELTSLKITPIQESPKKTKSKRTKSNQILEFHTEKSN